MLNYKNLEDTTVEETRLKRDKALKAREADPQNDEKFKAFQDAQNEYENAKKGSISPVGSE